MTIAIEKMQSLQPEGAQKAAAFIAHLASLEAQEDAEDAAAAVAALEEHQRVGGGMSLDELLKRLGE